MKAYPLTEGQPHCCKECKSEQLLLVYKHRILEGVECMMCGWTNVEDGDKGD